MGRVTVRVPATSANLGPGYDAFGLALAIHNTFSAELSEEWKVEVRGEDADHLKADATNPVARAMARVFEQAGHPRQAASLHCDNAVPTGRGLGSSAAAIVGGIVLASALVDATRDLTALLELASDIEGHPDNVAAAIHGGFVISAMEDGRPVARTVPVGGGLAAILVVSRLPFKTARARKLLPAQVLHADAAFNAGRAGMLSAGIALGRADLVAAGARDRLHERYRAEALPGAAEVAAVLRSGGADGAVLSGAGPTVIGLVLADEDGEALARARDIAQRCADPVQSIGRYRVPVAVPIDRTGVQLLG